MAVTNKLPFVVNLRKNNNMNSTGYGNYYPEADRRATINLKGFAKHMVEHGKRTDYADCLLFLQDMVGCLKELLCQNVPVKLDGLGIFSAALTKTQSYQTPAELVEHLEDSFKGIKINFRGEGAGDDDEKLTSPHLKNNCTFEAGYYVQSYKDANNVRRMRKTSINSVLNPQPNP